MKYMLGDNKYLYFHDFMYFSKQFLLHFVELLVLAKNKICISVYFVNQSGLGDNVIKKSLPPYHVFCVSCKTSKKYISYHILFKFSIH